MRLLGLLQEMETLTKKLEVDLQSSKNCSRSRKTHSWIIKSTLLRHVYYLQQRHNWGDCNLLTSKTASTFRKQMAKLRKLRMTSQSLHCFPHHLVKTNRKLYKIFLMKTIVRLLMIRNEQSTNFLRKRRFLTIMWFKILRCSWMKSQKLKR